MLTVSLIALNACTAVDGRNEKPHHVDLIFDTDLGGDVDDLGALAMLNNLQSAGAVNVLGVVASNPGNRSAPAAIDVVNTFYGHAHIPVATRDPLASPETMPNISSYAAKIAADFPHKITDQTPLEHATQFYRRVLSSRPNHSVTILVTGGQTDLARLLNSVPDRFSPMSGSELIKEKVRQLVVMAGKFPSGAEWNIQLDPPSAARVATAWPTKVLYSGFELGEEILSGARLSTDPRPNPVKAAYEDYVRPNTGHPSWDQTAAYLAVRGTDRRFKQTGPGDVFVTPNGTTAWVPDISGHCYRVSALASEQEISRIIDELMSPPRTT